MRVCAPHRWDLSYAEAVRVQEALASRVRLSGTRRRPRLVTGLDVAFDKAHGRAYAAGVTFSFPELEEVERAEGEAPLTFPYIPGLLTFREGPALLAALAALQEEPDLLIFDGQGIAHPRMLGLAAHMGVITGIRSIGVAKSLYVGTHGRVPERRGGSTALRLRGKEVGRVLRTRSGVRPVYVSPGHGISVACAADLALACCTRFRLPEPTRQADRLVAECKRRRIEDRRT